MEGIREKIKRRGQRGGGSRPFEEGRADGEVEAEGDVVIGDPASGLKSTLH